MADRREFQQERSRLLRDPEAGDDTSIGDHGTDSPNDVGGAEADLPAGTDHVEEFQAGTDLLPDGDVRGLPDELFTAPHPEVEVTAAIVDDGIAITFLIPHGLIGVALTE